MLTTDKFCPIFEQNKFSVEVLRKDPPNSLFITVQALSFSCITKDHVSCEWCLLIFWELVLREEASSSIPPSLVSKVDVFSNGIILWNSRRKLGVTTLAYIGLGISFLKIFYHITYPNHSFPSVQSPSLSFLPPISPQLPFLLPPEKNMPLGPSTKHSIICYFNTRHIPSYHDWMNDPVGRKES